LLQKASARGAEGGAHDSGMALRPPAKLVGVVGAEGEERCGLDFDGFHGKAVVVVELVGGRLGGGGKGVVVEVEGALWQGLEGLGAFSLRTIRDLAPAQASSLTPVCGVVPASTRTCTPIMKGASLSETTK